MGVGLHFRKTAVKIVDHIAKDIKSEIFTKIIELLLYSAFPFSQGWPQRIIILHIFLSLTSISFAPTSPISSFTTSKNLLFTKIIEQILKICVIVDEASTISNKLVIIIFLKIEDCNVTPIIFFDLVELEEQGAEQIYASLLKSLHD